MNNAQDAKDNYLKFHETNADLVVRKILCEIEQLSISGKCSYSFEYVEYPLRNVVIEKLRSLGFHSYVSGRSNEKISIFWE
jgi:hypothetical protein